MNYRKPVVGAILILCVLIGGGSVRAAQFLQWQNGLETSIEFGANREIVIGLGKINYITNCGPTGIDDFLFAAADIYVIDTGGASLVNGSTLEDIAGTPNTVIAPGGGGLFVSELIGFTQPSGAIGNGAYAIVYDECQDGVLGAEDFVFDPAFTVLVPTDVTELNPAIAQIKARAAVQLQYWSQLQAWFEIKALLDQLGFVGDLFQCGLGDEDKCAEILLGKLADAAADIRQEALEDLLGLSFRDPREAALNAVKNAANHYAGIAADPPDPIFRLFTALIAAEIVRAETVDPQQVPFLQFGDIASTEQALTSSLLTAIERYQGAQIARDGEWALQQARAIRLYAEALAEHLPATLAGLAAVENEVTTNPRPLEEVAAFFEEARQRILALGFSDDELLLLQNLDVSPGDIDEIRTRLTDVPFGTFFRADFIALLQDMQADNPALQTTLDDLVSSMDTIITDLEGRVTTTVPTADAGGPYAVAEGASITLDGSASTDPTGTIVAWRWDLNRNGVFDDATGETPQVTFPGAFEGLVGLEVENDRGRTANDYARIVISEVNLPPVIDSFAPALLNPEVMLGDTLMFSVTATDPDADPVVYEWFFDQVSAGNGSSFDYSPTLPTDVGIHIVRLEVKDDVLPAGGSVVLRWAVRVPSPDGDSDGYGEILDCNDADPDISPGAPERCDNLIDDNCSGDVDEGLGEACTVGLGACAAQGILGCAGAGLPTECSATPLIPGTEQCNGVDNDCDGRTDEGFDLGTACTAGIGGCVRAGVQICSGDGTTTVCGATAGAPEVETCDGVDDDCDGATDEMASGVPLETACYTGPPGTEDIGQCMSGFSQCLDGAFATCESQRTPVTETCNGLDDDCDGLVDNGVVGGPCVVEPGWYQTSVFSSTDIHAAHYNPVDGGIYFGRRGGGSDGLYRVDRSGFVAKIVSGSTIAGVVADDDGDVFFAEEGSSPRIYRVPFGQRTRQDWLAFFPGDLDPNGLAIAPDDYQGGVLAPGEALVVDQGFNGRDEVSKWSPDTPGNRVVLHADDGTLVTGLDIAIGRFDVHLADAVGIIYRLEPGGALTSLNVSGPLGVPRGIAVDPLTQDLLMTDGGDGRLLRIDPANGQVSEVLTSLGVAGSRSSIDIRPDGRQFFVSTPTAIRVFTRCDAPEFPDEDCNGNGILDECDTAYGSFPDCNLNRVPDECDLANATSFDCQGDGIPDECPECPVLDTVFMMDTSFSMNDEAGALCGTLGGIVTELASSGIPVETSLYGISTTPGGVFSCLTDNVINLYGTGVPGNPPPGNETLGECPGGNQSPTEDWGRATSVVAGRRSWIQGAARVIVPIADEGPWCGDPVTSLDSDSVVHAIEIATENDVTVSPITGDGSSNAVIAQAQVLAAGTGGEWHDSENAGGDIATSILSLSLGACLDFLDCDADGALDECQPDSDGDGVIDACDTCPSDPDKGHEGLCGCGVPDEDLDGDGFPGCEDCDDTDSDAFPGAVEDCTNAVDDDCDRLIDLDDNWDLDLDGVTTCDGDCDDLDANNFPGNAEACDGQDNNCDAQVDEGLTFDADNDGHTTPDSCEGTRDDCDDSDATIFPGNPELCDGKDNDCDGAVDNAPTDIGGACSAGVGECAADGFEVCSAGVIECDAIPGSPTPELCNGLDDDCDGATDNAPTDAGSVCSAGVGECAADGFEVCNAGVIECDAAPGSPTPELCNGLDDDCDGTTDNAPTDAGGACSAGVGECVADGFEVCNAGVIECDAVPGSPTPELCNGLDDDCDGTVDNAPTDAGGACSAGVGECAADGFEVCNAGVIECDAVPGSPTPELCNALDDDCDGTTDNAPTDAGGACSAGVGECAADGFEVCNAGVIECDAVSGSPTPELCNGLDDDCDGTTDNAPTDAGDACSAGVGECAADGFEVCNAGVIECDAIPGSPTPELCNGLDDDCDGTTDNAPTDAGSVCSAGVGECAADGFEVCNAGVIECDAVPGSPTPELCNALDDDCDGTTDNAPTDAGGACSAGVGECAADGFEVCNAGVIECDAVPGSPTPELCNGLDDDCDGTTDNAPTDAGGACSAGVGECAADGFEVCNAGVIECDAVPGSPTPELCNGLDDDCDGTTDNAPTDAGGACSAGVGECAADGFEVCNAGVIECDAVSGSPTPELCNGLDDDCDGTTDNAPTDAGDACSAGVGECAADGFEICSAGVIECDAIPGSPTPELCNGLDDDCDGTTDNAPTDAGGACSAGVGECAADGFEVCNAGVIECDAMPGSPTPELCNGLDDDCDGTTDNAPTDAGGACSAGVGECAADGFEVCSAGVIECDAVPGSPTPEVCNGLDDDCNGAADFPGETTDTDNDGTVDCHGTEVCDGLDNDGDGEIDEGAPETGAPCGTTDQGQCDLGVVQCIGGILECVGNIEPCAEICDGLDNDCDGEADEGPPVGPLVHEDFEESGDGANPPWLDTGAQNSLVEEDVFRRLLVNGERVFGTLSGQNNIHSHVLTTGSGGWRDYTIKARVRIQKALGGAGVTFYSDYPNANHYYRFRSYPGDPNLQFSNDPASPHGAYPIACDVGDTGVNPYDGAWHWVEVRVETRATETRMWGKAWRDGDARPVAWQQECWHSDPETRRTAGTVGFWSMGAGREWFDDLQVTHNDGSSAACGFGDEGECRLGVQVCAGGVVTCNGNVDPLVEACNGLDDDCDGAIDEGTGAGESCSAGTGECSRQGNLVCTTDGGGAECDAMSGDPRPEVCDGLDNDCNGLTDDDSAGEDSDLDGVHNRCDNCPNEANTDQSDRDGDGAGDACDPDKDGDGVSNAADCAPLLRGVSATPTSVEATLILSEDVGTLLQWAPGEQGHTSNIYRGSIQPGQRWNYNEVCFVAETPLPNVEDMSVPPEGVFYYYYVAANNVCGESPLGTDSRGVVRLSAERCPSMGREVDGDGVLDVADNCAVTSNSDQADIDADFVGDACDPD